MRIPIQSARTVSGLNVTIPTDFTGDRNALLIAFESSHLLFFNAWKSALREALAADQSLGFYAVALIGNGSAWTRQITRWALNYEVTEDFAREHTALVAVDPGEWGRHLGLRDFTAPLLVICSPDGEVHATAEGPPRAVTTQATARALLL
ncbi:MAG: hypothetical protein AAFO75_11780 [Pseudomonadota bacterium]